MAISKQTIRIHFRGDIVSVKDLPITTTVIDWLRQGAHQCGTKEGCAEGDCGACTVVVAELAAAASAPAGAIRVGGLDLRPINACIRFLPTLHGKALLTVEDLRGLAGGALHPVQQAMVDCHGSQCGFCTPGFVMSLFTLYLAHQDAAAPSRQVISDHLSGNLCRCTGYRPILDAGERMFSLPPVAFDTAPIEAALRKIAAETEQDFSYEAPNPAFRTDGKPRLDRFYAPRTAAALGRLCTAKPEARILGGATDIGLWVNKQFRDVGDLISVNEAAELRAIEAAPDRLTIGAAVPIEDAWNALADIVPACREMALRFAGPPVRHAGTMGGNVVNGSPIGDAPPVLMALDAVLLLQQGETIRRLPIVEFYLDYMKNARQPGEFLRAIEIPRPDPATIFRAYKISKRNDCDISAVSLGAAVTLTDGVVRDIRLAFGGMAATVRRAATAEGTLRGRPWGEAAIADAMAALDSDFTPLTDLRASASYRKRTARHLLRRLHLALAPEPGVPLLRTRALAASTPEGCTSELSSPGAAPARATPSHVAGFTPGLGVAWSEADAAALAAGNRVGVGVPHESAHLHVSGAAAYVDDVPERAGTLHAALGLSPVAAGRLLGIDFDMLRAEPGVVGIFTASDIPGANDCGAVVHDDPIFAERDIRHLGQPVFLVVATTRDLARRVAAKARDALRIEAAEPVLDPRAAHEAGRHLRAPMTVARESAPGAARQAIATARHNLTGRFSLGGQEQFYLEGQITYAIPTENDGMHVLCSTQHPSEMQHLIAHALGWRSHQVLVECRRMGGGFGGKETQSGLFACAASIAAAKLGRPVKLRLDRDDDFLATGRRHGFEYDYEVGFDDHGRIEGIIISMIANAGHSTDLSMAVLTRALCHADNAYFLPEVVLTGHLARTDTQSNTAFRGFGGPQGALVTEIILDSIARHLGRDALEIRRANFYGRTERNVTPYGQTVEDNVIHELVDQLVSSSAYRERRAAAMAFNAANTVLKKGLALAPVKFGISFNVLHLNQAGALVHVYADGSVLVNHGGTEMGQGLNTKVAQVVADELGIGFDQIRCTATDTSKIANTSATAASTGADLNGMAALNAARTIRKRLTDFTARRYQVEPESIRFANGVVLAGEKTILFTDLVRAAYEARVQLWSDGFYVTPKIHWSPETMRGRPFYYFAYGAAVSEVVIDTLTGEFTPLRTDILHDAGRSLNPAIDIGQIEGGFVQSMGWLTSEELIWHPKTGMLLTHAPSTYKIPTANDVPGIMNTRLFDNPNVEPSIHRSKAVGEPPMLLGFSVLLAIRDAISAVGDHRIDPPLRAPATPEAILDALDAVRAGSGVP